MNLDRLNLLGYGSKFPIPFDPYQRLKEDTYARFWPDRAAIPDPPLRNTFTGDYNLDMIDSPVLRGLAYLYNSQNLKDEPGPSSGGGGTGRSHGPVSRSRPSNAGRTLTDQQVVDFVSSLMDGKAPSTQGASAPDFASVVRGMPKASIITALHAAPIQFDPSRSPTPERAVSLPDALRVESSVEPSPHPAQLNAEKIPEVLTNMRLGLPQFKVAGEVDVTGKRPTKEMKQKPLPREEVSMAVDEKVDQIPLDKGESGGGMPTWAKALIALGGLGALAAIAKNGKFVQPGGKPLNWGRGLAMGASAAGQAIERNEERKREDEQRSQQMMSEILINQIKNSPDPYEAIKLLPPELRASVFAAASPEGDVPQPGTQLFSQVVGDYQAQNAAKEKRAEALSLFRTLDQLVLSGILAPNALASPGIVNALADFGIAPQDLSIGGQMTVGDALQALREMQATGGSLFGGE